LPGPPASSPFQTCHAWRCRLAADGYYKVIPPDAEPNIFPVFEAAQQQGGTEKTVKKVDPERWTEVKQQTEQGAQQGSEGSRDWPKGVVDEEAQGRGVEPTPPLVVNSFTGKYMQVLPDDHYFRIPGVIDIGDTYSAVLSERDFKMTGLQFLFQVEAAGLHTLSLRWAGGDAEGGGDSLYVVVFEEGTDKIQLGLKTLKPKMVKIQDTFEADYAGCCLDPRSHM
jgi:hypothetical protein